MIFEEKDIQLYLRWDKNSPKKSLQNLMKWPKEISQWKEILNHFPVQQNTRPVVLL